MRLVVRLDAANPHHNWQMSSSPTPSGGSLAATPRSAGLSNNANISGSLQQLSATATFGGGQRQNQIYQHQGGGTRFSVDDSDEDDDPGFDERNSDTGNEADFFPTYANNNHDHYQNQPGSIEIASDQNREPTLNNNKSSPMAVDKHQPPSASSARRQHPQRRNSDSFNDYYRQQGDEEAAGYYPQNPQQQHVHDLLDPSYNEEDKTFGLSVDGPSVVITPRDKRAVQQNRYSTQQLANRVDNLNVAMRHQMNNLRHEQKAVRDDLVRLHQQRPPRQLPSMQPEQEVLRGRVVNFVEAEKAAQEGQPPYHHEPVLGEYLDQLQQMAALRGNTKLHREASFGNEPHGVGSNFDGSYINVNGIGGATVTPRNTVDGHSMVPNSWQMPSWVMRQGYNLKQQMLLQKAQQQLTPILKQQNNNRYGSTTSLNINNKVSNEPVIVNRAVHRQKSPSTKRVSWSERVDAIAIPLQTNSDRPLRKPGQRNRQRSTSPLRRNVSVLVSQQQTDQNISSNNTSSVIASDDHMMMSDDESMPYSHEGGAIRRTPRPGSSEAAILDRLGQQQPQQQPPHHTSNTPINDDSYNKRTSNNNTARHRHITRLVHNNSSTTGRNGTLTPSSLSLSFTSSSSSTSSTPPTSFFGAFPASDDATMRSSRHMLRSALRMSPSREDVAALRRWRSLEAVLQRRNNMHQHLASAAAQQASSASHRNISQHHGGVHQANNIGTPMSSTISNNNYNNFNALPNKPKPPTSASAGHKQMTPGAMTQLSSGRNSPGPPGWPSHLYILTSNNNPTNNNKFLQRQGSLNNVSNQTYNNPRHHTPTAPSPALPQQGLTLMINNAGSNNVNNMGPTIVHQPVANNSSSTALPINVLRVTKVDPDSYHVSLGIRIPSTASLNTIGTTPAANGTSNGNYYNTNNNHHQQQQHPNVMSSVIGSGSFLTTAISAGR